MVQSCSSAHAHTAARASARYGGVGRRERGGGSSFEKLFRGAAAGAGGS